MSNIIIPILIIAIFVWAGLVKRINTYSSFVAGARDAVKLVMEILPFVATILIAIQLFHLSGLLDLLCVVINPVFALFGIPSELSTFIILKPFSGSGSITLFNDIVKAHGPDSYITRVASVIAGSSETVFYIAVVYFSKTKIRRLGWAIPIALLCTFATAVFAAGICLVL